MSSSDDSTRRSPGRPRLKSGGVPMRETVLDAASQLFMELGYEPVSINMIAERAGVTKASVYYYFANKAELFTTAVIEMFVRIRMRTQAFLVQEGNLRTRLTKLARVKLSRTHTDFESMMKEAVPFLSEEQLRSIREAEHDIHEELASTFRFEMERGDLKPGDPMLLSHAFSALLMLGNRERFGERQPTVEELAEEIIELFWNGAGRR